MPMESFADRVIAWYEDHGRHDLPWQCPATPYRVWLSEIMLQQTRVETVRPYFARFIDRFPGIAQLANGELDEVLSLWAGLGYYARARNLHRTARIVQAEHGGELPSDFDVLVALPGVGRSTAGAILSLAHGQRQAILDGNVKRVLARHAGIEGWPGRAPVARALWTCAEERTPGRRVAAYNQAMMDLGAGVCMRQPRCGVCPVAADCRARIDGHTDRIPGAKPKREVPQRETLVLVLQRRSDGAILLQRRPPQGIWGGLWSLPEFPDREALEQWLASRLRETPAPESLDPVQHAFTHFRLRIHPCVVRIDDETAVGDGASYDWYTRDNPPGGLPAPIQRIAERVERTTA